MKKWYQYVEDESEDEKMGMMMTMKISKLLKHKADDRELDDSTSLNGSVI